MTEIRKQVVFVDSDHSDDVDHSHNDFSINFEDAQIRCDEDEIISMELFDLVAVNSVYQIEKGINDRFFVEWYLAAGSSFNRVWIEIPIGRYTGTSVATILQTMLNNYVTPLVWTVVYDRLTHKLTFDVASWGSTADLHVAFIMDPLTIARILPPDPPTNFIYSSKFVNVVLGISTKVEPGVIDSNHHTQYVTTFGSHEIIAHFRKGVHPSQSARFTSNVPINLGGALTSFTINTDIPNDNLETTPSLDDGMKYSSIMARIPVMVPTGGVIYYHTISDNNIRILLPQKYVDRIRFTIRDSQDGPVQFKQSIQFTLIFKVSKRYNRELNDPTTLFLQMIEYLKDISMINKMLFISKNSSE